MAHLLLVEDDEASATALQSFLTRCGYRVTLAHDGHEALRRHRESAADLVVTDIRMPRLSGVDLARELRESQADLPVLFVSAFGQEAEPLLESEAPTVVLHKPIDPVQLDALIGSVLRLKEDRA
jgi:DNA-binding response OmpR family regulator